MKRAMVRYPQETGIADVEVPSEPYFNGTIFAQQYEATPFNGALFAYSMEAVATIRLTDRLAHYTARVLGREFPNMLSGANRHALTSRRAMRSSRTE